MLTVGLTGSIAVGKSFVCSVFRELGCHILDADQTARDVVAVGTEGLSEIVRQFGGDVLQADGSLDRKKMAGIVFSGEEKRLLLNSIIHPRVFDAQNDWIKNVAAMDPNGIAIIDAALTIESGGYKRFDKLIVVWCESAIQLERLMLRDNLSETDARKRIAAQMPQEEKKRFAQYLIDTSRGFEETREQVVEVFQELSSIK
ncbi:MAG TPA: dephospho-CoA kinase [Pyrinomonadaceae bacterium]|nr:dephospho-CoA kinase [Acidobacteriota bacterium]HQZ95373.1 dephospho-CoA kinase [Pyrinomonadaceae bacterium]